MPRRNRRAQSVRRLRVQRERMRQAREAERDATPTTPLEMAKDLVRRGVADRAILGPSRIAVADQLAGRYFGRSASDGEER